MGFLDIRTSPMFMIYVCLHPIVAESSSISMLCIQSSKPFAGPSPMGNQCLPSTPVQEFRFLSIKT